MTRTEREAKRDKAQEENVTCWMTYWCVRNSKGKSLFSAASENKDVKAISTVPQHPRRWRNIMIFDGRAERDERGASDDDDDGCQNLLLKTKI